MAPVARLRSPPGNFPPSQEIVNMKSIQGHPGNVRLEIGEGAEAIGDREGPWTTGWMGGSPPLMELRHTCCFQRFRKGRSHDRPENTGRLQRNRARAALDHGRASPVHA